MSKPLKYENLADVGDTIRAYDFEPMVGRDDRYVEGVVIAKGWNGCYECYTIYVTKDSTSRMRSTVFVPYGVSPMEFEGRVTLISKK